MEKRDLTSLMKHLDQATPEAADSWISQIHEPIISSDFVCLLLSGLLKQLQLKYPIFRETDVDHPQG